MDHQVKESLEAIAFQTDSDYTKRLSAQFKRCIDAQGSLRVIDDALNIICEMTRGITGIWMEPSLTEGNFVDGKYYVACVTENLNALSPLNPKAIAKLEKYDLENLEAIDILDGEVDLKRARVTGFFTRIKNQFKMSQAMFDGTLSPDELTAVYLHEVGHAWVIYEYLGETLITNTILTEVMGLRSADMTVEKRLTIGRAVVKLSGNPAEVVQTDEASIIAMVLQGQSIRMANKVGTRWYDQRLAEALSDQFAARWLMGAPLVKAIGKLERRRGLFARQGYEPKWLGITFNFLTFATYPFVSLGKGLGIAAKTALMTIGRGVAFNGPINALLFLLSGGRYDSPRDRIDAIRRESVTLLKDRKLPPVIRKKVLEDLKLIDEERKSLHHYSDVMSRLTDFIIDISTKRHDELTANNLSEDLANNRLYELAALLKD